MAAARGRTGGVLTRPKAARWISCRYGLTETAFREYAGAHSWRAATPGLRKNASQNNVSHASHRLGPDVIRLIRCACVTDSRSPMAMPYRAYGHGRARRETVKIKIRKTNLECPLESMR